VRKTPRSVESCHGSPSAATTTSFVFAGSIEMRAICELSRRPARCQVFAASCESQSPSPHETSLRGLDSPVPTHTVASFAGSIAIAPIAANGCVFHTLANEMPPFVDFQTPPPAAPT
jgi:hypothetical protein